jgi:hypothetical protein
VGRVTDVEVVGGGGVVAGAIVVGVASVVVGEAVFGVEEVDEVAGRELVAPADVDVSTLTGVPLVHPPRKTPSAKAINPIKQRARVLFEVHLIPWQAPGSR